MNKRISNFLIIVFSLFLTPIIESAEIEMTWRVNDNVSNLPVGGAEVVCEVGGPIQLVRKDEIRANREGQFSIDFESKDNNRPIDLIVYKSGYKETTFVDTVEKGRFLARNLYLSPSQTVRKPAIEEKDTVILTGTVKDSDTRRPLSGVLLHYDLSKPRHNKPEYTLDTLTDSLGSFKWPFHRKHSEDLLSFKASKTNYVELRQDRTLGDGGQLNLYLAPVKKERQFSGSWKDSFYGAAAFGNVFTFFNWAREGGKPKDWSKTDTYLAIPTGLAWFGYFDPFKWFWRK